MVLWYSINVMSNTDKQIDFKDVKEALKDLVKSQKETDRQLKETDRQLKKSKLDLDRHFKETERERKKLHELFTGQWGRLVEALVEGGLVNFLKQRQINISTSYSRVKKTLKKGQEYEFDIVAANGSEVVPVEVKTTMDKNDVDDFIKKLKIFKTLFSAHKNKKIYGAVAYLKAHQSSHVYAERQGLFVIRAVEDSASITNEKAFKPRAF